MKEYTQNHVGILDYIYFYLCIYMAVSQNKGPHFGSPYNKDHNIFGPILGPPIYGSPHPAFGMPLGSPGRPAPRPAGTAPRPRRGPGPCGGSLGARAGLQGGASVASQSQIYIYIYICLIMIIINMYIYICIYTYVYKHMCMYIHTYTHLYIHVRERICKHTSTYLNTHVYT